MVTIQAFIQMGAILTIAGLLLWANRLTRRIRLRGRVLLLTGFLLVLANRFILLLERVPALKGITESIPGSLVFLIATVGFLSAAVGTLIVTPSLYVALSAKKNIDQSDERYRLITENISDVVFLVDLNFNWLYITPSVKQFRGFTPEEALRQKVDDVLTPGSIQTVKKVVRQEIWRDKRPGVDPDRVKTLELEFYHKDGRVVTGEVTASFLRDQEGRIIGLQGTNRDISERKQAERIIQESEERFRKAFMLNPEAVALNRVSDGMFVEYNQRFLEASGYDPEDIDGKTMLEVGIWADLDQREEFRKTLLDNGFVQDFEVVYRRKDGRISIGLTSAALVHLSGEAHVLTITKDITEIRQAQIAIEESEEKLRSTLQAIGDCVFMIDRDFNILWANDQAVDKLGMVAGTKCHNSLMGENEICSGCNARQTFEDGLVRTKEMELKTRSGTGSFLVTCAPVRDKNGNINSVVETAKDISELKVTEAKLVKTIEEKESLLSEIHHRVKNNLQAISGMLDIQSLRIDDPISGTAIRESQNRILSMALIHEHLYRHQDMSRIDFTGYTKQLVQNLRTSYGPEKEYIEIDVSGKDIMLNSDTAIPCSLILTELVSNALQHAFSDGSGRISININYQGDGSYMLSVSDNGGSMPPGMDIHSTDSFGLMLVRTFVDLLGGRIEMSSEKETTFTITFREYKEEHTLTI